jgi:hypothetical protein
VAVVTILDIPGLTREQYERAGQVLPPGPPEGIHFHSCGPIEGGWRIVDVWESRSAYDTFLDRIFLPAIRSVGGAEPVRRDVMDVHHAGPVVRAHVPAASVPGGR